MNSRLLRLLCILLISFGALGQNSYPFEIRAPATWAGESVSVLSGNFGGENSLGTFQLYGDALLPITVSLDVNDPAFYAVLGVGSSFSIIDQAAIQAAVANSGILYLNLQPLPNTVPVVRLLIPMERSGNSFALVQQTPGGVVISTPLNLSGIIMDLNTATSYQRGSATYDPALPFWAMDLTAHELAPQSAVDLRAVTWTPSASQYPLRSVAIYFDHAEAGHRFTVHSRAGDGPEMRSSGPTVYVSSSTHPVLDVAVGEGMSFWVTREADGWSSLTTTGPPWVASDTEMQALPDDGDGWSAMMGMFPHPPQRGPMQTKHFRVHNDNRGSHSFSVRMSDGYSTSFNPSYNVESVANWDDSGIPDPSPLSVAAFDAQIDPARAWWLHDATTNEDFPIGQTDVFDGWPPFHTMPPPAPTITLKLPVWRSNTTMVISETGNGTWSGDSFAPWEGTWSQEVFQGAQGMDDYTIETVTTTQPNPRPYEGGPFTLNMQVSAVDNTRPVYAGDNDLRLNWFGPTEGRALAISTSRNSHSLILRHPNGDSYPVFAGATLGTYYFTPSGATESVPYYYFEASANHHPELPWYVQDLDTGERIGPNPSEEDLILWFALPDPLNLIAVQEHGQVVLRWNAHGANPEGGFGIERRVGATGPWVHRASPYAGDVIDAATGLAQWSEPLHNPLETLQYRLYYAFGGRHSARSNEAPIDLYDSAGVGHGLPDVWEILYFNAPNTNNGAPGADPDGDGVNNLAEYYNGTSPTDFFDGIPPTLEVFGVPPNIVESNQVSGQSLNVRVVWTGTGHGLVNAPVEFDVVSSSPDFPWYINTSAAPLPWQHTHLNIGTSATGAASVFILPAFEGVGTSVVTAKVGSGTASQIVSLSIAAIHINPAGIITTSMSLTPTGVVKQQGDRNYEEMSRLSAVNGVFWRYSLPVTSVPITINRTSSDQSICVPEPQINAFSKFRWVRQGTGSVTLFMEFGPSPGLSKSQNFDLNATQTTTEPRFGMPPPPYEDYVSGSAAQHCAHQIDDKIAGKNSSHLKLFSVPATVADHANGIYVRNPNCWANDIDLTCVPVWNSQYQGPYTLGCLVAPRIVLVANHFAASEGTVFRFVSKTINPETGTNDVYTATVKKWVPLQTDYIDRFTPNHDFDLGFLVLDHALDPTIIKPAKILGSVDHLGVDDPYWGGVTSWGVPCLGMNQQGEAFVQDSQIQNEFGNSMVRFAWTNSVPTNPQRFAMYRQVGNNDSSNPCFLIKDGTPVLVTLWTYSGAGVAIQHFANPPNPAPNIINLSTKIAEYRASSTNGIPNDDSIPENWQLQFENFDTYPFY